MNGVAAVWFAAYPPFTVYDTASEAGAAEVMR